MYLNNKEEFKRALVFPGQGSQYTGMGRKMYENFNVVRQLFEEASDAVKIDIKKLCFEGLQQTLNLTENAQPAILLIGFSAFKVLRQEKEIEPDYLAGNSIGEITSLTCSGFFEFADAIKLVKLRGKYMQEAMPEGAGIMYAINGSTSYQVYEVCEKLRRQNKHVYLSNYNTEIQNVISGETEAVLEAVNLLEKYGTKAIKLKVSAPFHSPLMYQSSEKFREALINVKRFNFNYPVISSVTAMPYTNEECVTDMLVSQICKPVQWVRTIKYLEKRQVYEIIDMGPSSILKNMIKNNSKVKVYAYDSRQGDNILCDFDHDNKKDEINKLKECLKIAVCSPNVDTTLQEEEEIQNCICELYDINTNNNENNFEFEKRAIDLIKKILELKHIPEDEKKMRFDIFLD